jgi:nucleolysin TIA-1/TIAR
VHSSFPASAAHFHSRLCFFESDFAHHKTFPKTISDKGNTSLLTMSDNGPPPTGSQLPPPPQSSVGAPGYENGQNGQGNPHMPPPPLPPVIIPQNTNPIPTAITSPMSGGENGGVLSPGSAGGFARRAAPEPNKRALYVGGLDPRVTEDVLRQIFETTGHVQNVKIIPDKNVGAVSIKFISVYP